VKRAVQQSRRPPRLRATAGRSTGGGNRRGDGPAARWKPDCTLSVPSGVSRKYSLAQPWPLVGRGSERPPHQAGSDPVTEEDLDRLHDGDPAFFPGPHRNLRAVCVVLLSVPREGPRWSGGSVSGCLAEGMAQTTVVSGTWLLPRLAVPPDFKSRPLAPQVRGATGGRACPLVGGVGRPPVRPTSASHPERSNTGDPPRCRSAPSKAAGGPIARPHGFPAHPRRGRDDGRFTGDGSLPASTCPQSPEVQA
jgi:hypothetical protein